MKYTVLCVNDFHEVMYIRCPWGWLDRGETCWVKKTYLRFLVPMAASVKMTVFWDAAPYSLLGTDRCFRSSKHLKRRSPFTRLRRGIPQKTDVFNYVIVVWSWLQRVAFDCSDRFYRRGTQRWTDFYICLSGTEEVVMLADRKTTSCCQE
jgi:hypothetical protein